MSIRELYTSNVVSFAGAQLSFEEADYIVIGVPLDITSTYRSGSRFAPSEIRQASINIENHSFRAKRDFQELKIHDSGDLHIEGGLDVILKRLELIVEEIFDSGKTPVFVGGEHTITLGVTKGVGNDFGLLCFDAHLDLRNEYLGKSVSHATVIRCINELVKPIKIVEVGTRAVCKDELIYAKKRGISYITACEIAKNGIEVTADKINDLLHDCNNVYLTIDMDVLDPAFAPAVQNPEPEGLSTYEILELLFTICDQRVISFDLTEVTPHYDNGNTSVQAAKIISEILMYIDD